MNGGANTGGGGGGTGEIPKSITGGTGGPGIVVIKEPSYPSPASAPGVWQMNTVYEFVKDDNWIYNQATINYLVMAGGAGGGHDD